MTYYIGIDPGMTGAIAVLKNEALSVYKLDNKDVCHALSDVFSEFLGEGCCLAIEHVHAMPGQSVSSMFNFGREYGRILGWFDAVGIPYTLYTPQRWQKVLGSAENPKVAVREFCERTWGLKAFIAPGCRVPHQGCMDAAVIAEFHKRCVLSGLDLGVDVKAHKPKRRPLQL